MVRSKLILVAFLALLAAASPATAQTLGGSPPLAGTLVDGNAVDALARQKRIAATGTLGFPPLPAITAGSPRNSLFYADRLPYGAMLPSGNTQNATIVNFQVPKELTGTGFEEFIDYQLPDNYSAVGTPHPMVVAYHGYGGSAASVAAQSTLDEEANNRDWMYLSVTGLDDQLFGAAISQQNTYAAIEYMLNNFNVDPDRLYLVGFSAGAGISVNFAARHRDPAGVMIAGLGLVSASGDWTMEYTIGDANLQAWMENPYNFDGPPGTKQFGYQAASAIFNSTGSYPPLWLASPDSSKSMVTNLASVPTYITYDSQDTLSQVPVICDQLESELNTLGASVQKTIVTGTVLPGPPSVPAPHSWAVLDEVDLFDFFDGLSVDRTPDEFEAQQDLGGPVSWASTTQLRDDQFVYIDGEVVVPAKLITVSSLTNATTLEIDAAEAGLTGAMPYRIQVTNSSLGSTRVVLKGFPNTPSRLVVPGTSALVTLVDSDPVNGSLSLDVAGLSSIDVRVIHDPLWVTELTTSPNPVSAGDMVTVHIDGPAGDTNAYMVVSLSELLTPIGAITMTAFPAPPALIQFLPLNASGDIIFGQIVPNDPSIVGFRFPTQVVTTDAGGVLQTVSNLWGLYISS